MPSRIELDLVIFGGGCAGLWTLDAARRGGYSAVLLEAGLLGGGQTTWSQGIIHGGVKYTLSGAINPSAQAIRDMPAVWSRCLEGDAEPDLSEVALRSGACWMWRTASLRSKAAMIGARAGLRASASAVAPEDRPEILRRVKGTVALVEEPVIDPVSFTRVLAERNEGLIFAGGGGGTGVRQGEDGVVVALGDVELSARRVLFAAGAGNGVLRERVGLDPDAMQLRPLHMAMVRSPRLPMLNGHCVDGMSTRVTITAGRDGDGNAVWQLGGQIAERGVAMEPRELLRFARAELLAVLPELDLEGAAWASYRVDRAEGQAGGVRPEDAVCLEDGPVITAWPTKLALAPRVAQRTLEMLGSVRTAAELSAMRGLPRPELAPAPWDRVEFSALA